jgi:hypothetical protein
VRREPIDKISDARLVRRLDELSKAKVALDEEHLATVAEYVRRRIALVKAGKQATGALAEPVGLSYGERDALHRREQLAAEHRVADQLAVRQGLIKA